MRAVATLLLLAVVGIPLGRPQYVTASSAACSMSYFSPPLIKWDSLLHVGAVVLPGRILQERWNERSPPERDALMSLWPRGQVVRIADIEHGPTTNIDEGSEIVIFRWSLGIDCRWTPRRDSLPVGSEQFLTLVARPDSLWVGGLPTYDIGPPHTVDAFPGPTEPLELTMPVYRDFVDQLPTEAEWKSECRPAVRRVETWIESHPGVADHPRISMALRQRANCNSHLYNRDAYGQMRWGDVDTAPSEIEEWALDSGCGPISDEPSGRFRVVPGDFTDSEFDEWAFICREDDGWTLKALAGESPLRVTDVMSMVGDPANWLLVAANSRIFEFVTAVEFLAEPDQARPARDVLLLHQMPFERKIALYYEDGEWRSARVRCCHWPDD